MQGSRGNQTGDVRRIAVLKKAGDESPEEAAGVHYALARVLLENGRPAEAVEHAETALAADRDDGAFRVQDVDEAAAIVRAIIDGLFLQWLQEENWERLHPHYRATCKRAVLAYLKGSPAGS